MKKLMIFAIAILIFTLASCSTTPESPAIDPAVYELGENVFQANCASCHSPNYDVVLVGPTMLGLASRAGNMIEGMDARSYIIESILEPSAFLNEGFHNLMPATYNNSLDAEELDALVEYLLTFE